MAFRLEVKRATCISTQDQFPFVESAEVIAAVIHPRLSLTGGLVRDADLATDHEAGLVRTVEGMRDVITRLHALRVDHTEYACLKALILFRPGESPSPVQLKTRQDRTSLSLKHLDCATIQKRFALTLTIFRSQIFSRNLKRVSGVSSACRNVITQSLEP